MLRVLALLVLMFLGAGVRAEARYDSWQVRHPVATAFVSTLGLWQLPSRFGDDLAQVDDRMENGWTPAALELLMPHAIRAYRFARMIILFLEVLLLLFIIFKARRKVRK